MANRVLSIEIGSVITRVVEVDYKVKNPRIYRVFTFTTPPNMITDGNVNVSDAFISVLKGNLAERKISTKQAIFIVNSTRVASRTVQIPHVKENRVADLLKSNASDYFPVDLSQYELSHEVLGQVMDGTEKKLQISIVAVPKDIIASYENLAQACGLALVGLDYLGNCIKKLMIREIPEAIKVTIKINEDSTIITFMENDVIQLQRTVNYGISDTINAVLQSNVNGRSMDEDEALKFLKRKTCILRRFDQNNAGLDEDADRDFEVDAAKMKQLRIDITDDLRPMVGSIARVLDYYQTRNPDKTIERIYLAGIGSACSGLSKLMTNELGYKVVAVQQYADMSMSKNAEKENVHVAEFFGCLGAALEPLSLSFSEKKGSKKAGGAGAEKTKDSFALPAIVCGLGVIAAAAMIVYSLVSNMMLRAENLTLTAQVNNLSYIEDIVAEYDAAKANDDWALAVLSTTSSDNDGLVAFIEELEKKMPSEINVLTLSASETSVNLNIQVTSKSAVADIIAQLRTFDSIVVGNVSTITDTEDESGVSVVSFSVDCAYVEPVSDTSQQTDTGTSGDSQTTDDDLSAEE
jgi:type IV pilus assembly protein PilM